MFTNIEKLISYRNLRPKRKEGFLKVISIFSFLGISIGVSILIIVMSVMNGFRTDLTNKILGLNPHIIISSTNISPHKILNNQIKSGDIKISRSLSGEGVLINKNLTTGVIIKGVERKNNPYTFLNFHEKKKNKKQNLKKIIIGSELAFDLNLKVGDKINIMSTKFITTPAGAFPKQESFLIIDNFNTGFFEYDKKVVFLEFNEALNFFSEDIEKVNYELFLKNPLQADEIKKKIQKVYPDIIIYTWADQNKSFLSALKVERNVMFIILTLIIIVAAFNIISGLTILIKNKTKEIAILKTLGLSSLSIKKSFFLSGFIIGLLATITGTIIGVFFSIYIEEIRLFLSSVFNINIFPSDVYILDELPSELNFNSVLLVSITSLIISSLASYFPARAISKMDTSIALKYE